MKSWPKMKLCQVGVDSNIAQNHSSNPIESHVWSLFTPIHITSWSTLIFAIEEIHVTWRGLFWAVRVWGGVDRFLRHVLERHLLRYNEKGKVVTIQNEYRYIVHTVQSLCMIWYSHALRFCVYPRYGVQPIPRTPPSHSGVSILV